MNILSPKQHFLGQTRTLAWELAYKYSLRVTILVETFFFLFAPTPYTMEWFYIRYCKTSNTIPFPG